jgi:hypothetical protein
MSDKPKCKRCGAEHESIRAGKMVEVKDRLTWAGPRFICRRCELALVGKVDEVCHLCEWKSK